MPEEGGISTIKEGVAANRFLSGPQAQSAIGALREQQRVAGRAPAALQRAAQAGLNQLRQVQSQRAASMRGSGVATGGGAGGGSGTAQMRQDIASAAQQMAAEQAVQGAEMEAAKVDTEATGEIAKIQAEEQMWGPNFVSDISTEISEMGGIEQRAATTGSSIANKLNSVDLTNPTQRQAAIDGLALWLAQRGWRSTPAELAALVDAGRAGEIATNAGMIAPTAGPTGINKVGYLAK